jgi:hypothetical protein
VSRVFRGGNNACGVSRGPAILGDAGEAARPPTLVVMTSGAGQPSQAPQRGASLGLPPDGPGSLAAFSTRVCAYLVDAVGSALIAWAFTAPSGPGNWSLLVFGVLTVVTLVLSGQTPGHRLLGLRLAHPRPGARLAPWRAVVRTALLILLVPALITDANGRGLHDRLTQTAVVLA